MRVKSTGFEQARQVTAGVDAMLRAWFARWYENARSDWCLLAVGGYGRSELCPHSDIDLLIILNGRKRPPEIETILTRLVYPLWDAGWSASYSVRTLRQTLKDAENDFFLRTALLDARFLCGSERLFMRFCDRFEQQSPRTVKRFMFDLGLHNQKRYETFGDASYILEPDLKDGRGGLRDYHGMRWLAKASMGLKDLAALEAHAVIGPLDCHELEAAVDFLLRIRHRLHTIAGRKNDRLDFEYQEIIARELAFEDCSRTLAVEMFMKQFHRSTLTIKSITEAAMLNITMRLRPQHTRRPIARGEHFALDSGCVAFTKPDDVQPLHCLQAFSQVADLGLPLHPQTRAFIREHLQLIPKLRHNGEAKAAFLSILDAPFPESALVSLLETGVLERFIPEFERIKGRIQYDVYHTFTVDMHCIHAVDILRNLEDTEASERVSDRPALLLAGLLHDIGKGHGGDHAQAGGSMAYAIARRLDLTRAQAELVRFLVANHLILSNTALRRDLTDEKVAAELALKMGDSRRLSMLYLLSIADARATGPSGWNDWKASLFHELFHKALTILEKGDLKDPKSITRLDRKWEQLITQAPSELGAKQAGRLWALPQAYILAFDVPEIIAHLQLSALIHTPHDLGIKVTDRGDRSVLTMIAQDRPGLVATLTGLLACRHIDIHRAKVFTWGDGLAVDAFEVTPPWRDYRDWDRLPLLFQRITTGELDLAQEIAAAKPLLRPRRRLKLGHAPRIAIDNATSDFFTLIEVYAEDRLGLLHDITRTMNQLGLDIHRALIANKGDLAADVFYVVNAQGEKIEDEQEREHITDELVKELNHRPLGAPL